MLNRKSSADNAEDFLLFCSIEAWQWILENLYPCLGISLYGGEVCGSVSSRVAIEPACPESASERVVSALAEYAVISFTSICYFIR